MAAVMEQDDSSLTLIGGGGISMLRLSSQKNCRILKNRYIINENEVLGKGGFATVYKGLDKQECRNVAIKVYDHSIDETLVFGIFKRSIQVCEAISGDEAPMMERRTSFDPSALDVAAFEAQIKLAQVEKAGTKSSKKGKDAYLAVQNQSSKGRAPSKQQQAACRYTMENLLEFLDVSSCFVQLLDYSHDEDGDPGLDPEEQVLYLVFEIGDQSLEDTIKDSADRNRQLTKDELRQIQWALISIVWGLHTIGYVHMDIKPKNVMRFGSGASAMWKLIDLDGAVATGSKQLIENVTYTPEYMPPELAAVCASNANPAKVSKDKPTLTMSRLMDVWSVGMCALEAVFQQPVLSPFYDAWHEETGNDLKFYTWLGDTASEPIVEGDMKDHIKAIDPDLADLLAGMLQRDPEQRFCLGKCMAHKWFSSTREQAIDRLQDAWVTTTPSGKIQANPTRTSKACTVM